HAHGNAVSAANTSQNAGRYGPTNIGTSQVASSRRITIAAAATRGPPAASATATPGPGAKYAAIARPRNQPLSSTRPVAGKSPGAPAGAATRRAAALTASPEAARRGAATASAAIAARPTLGL